MEWDFKPVQTKVKVVPGETALAFYTARNPTDEAVIGISSYNVLPYEACPLLHFPACFGAHATSSPGTLQNANTGPRRTAHQAAYVCDCSGCGVVYGRGCDLKLAHKYSIQL